MNGTPVKPSSLTSAPACPLSRLPPAANPTSFHVIPASASASRAAISPISRPLMSKRPNGCRPTPTIETVMRNRPRARSRTTTRCPPRRDVRWRAAPHRRSATRRGAAGEARLDPNRAEVDVADGKWLERLGPSVGRLGLDVLDRPSPQLAAVGQRDELGRRAAVGAGELGREGMRSTGPAHDPDEVRPILGEDDQPAPVNGVRHAVSRQRIL